MNGHSECPGHAVEVSLDYSGEEVKYIAWCLDPVLYEHVEPEPDYPESDDDGTDGDEHASSYNGVDNATERWVAEQKKKDEASAERKLVLKNNKAWRDAEPVRRDFLRELYARRTPPKGCTRFIAELLPHLGYLLQHTSETLLADLTGVTMTTGYGQNVGADVVRASTDKALPVAMLAVVGTAVETTSDVAIWRNGPGLFAVWLRYLATVGYTLSDVEQGVVDELTKREAEVAKRKKK